MMTPSILRPQALEDLKDVYPHATSHEEAFTASHDAKLVVPLHTLISPRRPPRRLLESGTNLQVLISCTVMYETLDSSSLQHVF